MEEQDSNSYPGLECIYTVHHVDVNVRGLPEQDFVTREKRDAGWLENHWAWVDATTVQH